MPVVATGYERRTQGDILEAIQDAQRSTISAKLDLSERTVLGSINPIFAEHVDQLEQLAEECYSAFDPDNASDDRFVALCLLTGVPRRAATKGLAEVTLSLEASKTYAPGDLVAHVTDEVTNRWLNRDTVTSTTAGSYTATFESEFASADAVAPAGTLTVIASPTDGWLSITNADDATSGTDIEDIEALRLRREQAVSIGGSRTRGSIRSALVLLDGVLSAEVFENTSNVTDANGLPPHSLRATVYDGDPAAADNDQIAQVIYDRKAEGIVSDGTEVGVAQDSVLGPVSIAFARALTVDVTVAVEIESATGVSIDDVRDAIVAAMPDRVGEEVTFNRLAGSVFRVGGVDDHVSFTINGGTDDLPALVSTIYLLDPTDINVTGNVS
jgi:uncharacterized phage protein gp47/JayE